jgi:DNA-binding transcriptional LysR family regulator
LEYLCAVGEAGSIALAAERINVSSPSISAAIGALEAELGVQLFVRKHAQGLSLTPGGKRIYTHAKHVLENATALHDVAGEVAQKIRGPIGVGCFVTLAPMMIGALRRTFQHSFPETQVTLSDTHHFNLLEMLQRAEIDIALTYDLEIPKDVSFEKLAEMPPFVMINADHRLATKRSVRLEDMIEDGMVLLDLPLSREYFLSMFQAQGLRPKISDRTSHSSVVRSIVANGEGYSLVNTRPSNDLAPDGRQLVYIPLEGDHRPMNIGLATMRTDRKTRIVQAFEQHAREHVTSGSAFWA